MFHQFFECIGAADVLRIIDAVPDKIKIATATAFVAISAHDSII